jgi:hypothetical protein
MAKKVTQANASPKGGKRGCLCKDGTYSSECCDGTLPAQGIGSDLNQSTANITNANNERVITSSNG